MRRVSLPARRLLCSSSAPRPLLTRSAKFREHVHELHRGQPERWTDVALAEHFGVPLANIQGALALKQLESDQVARGGPLDPELVALDEDIEEYMCEDDDPKGPAASSPSQSAAPDAAASDAWIPDIGLDHMPPEQEAMLARAVVRRFAETPMDAALEALSPTEIDMLARTVSGEAGAGPPAADHAEALRGLLATVAIEMPPELHDVADGELDLSRVTPLPPTALPAPPRRSASDAAAGAAAADDGVTQIGVQSRVSVASTPTQARFSVVDDRGPDAAAYFEPEVLERLQRPRAPDSGEQLARNLALREERLYGDKSKLYQSSGRLLFAEVSKKGRKPTSVERVWVSERDRTVRDADDDEAAQATRRVLPRQAASRIKRNA